MIKRRRLVWQLYPSYLVLILIALLATGWYASYAMRSLYMSQVRQDLLHQARFLTYQLLPFMAPLDQPALDRICKQAVLDMATRLTVILPDGQVVGDSETDPLKMENHGDRPEIEQALAGRIGTSLRFSETLGQQMIYLAYPLKPEAGKAPAIQGVVRVSLALTAIERQLDAFRLRLAMGGIVVAVLASLVCLVISRRISRPIEIMRQSAARFAQGELSHRLALPQTAELAGLAQALNQMAQELERRIQAIVQQRNESEAVLSSMVEGVVALDADERITHHNAAALRLLKGSAESLQGRSIQEVMRNRELHHMVRATLDYGDVGQGDIALYQTGEQILNAHCTPIFDDQGRRVGALLVMNDVTQFRRLETMRSDFAANVSHEIKTPLTAIQGFVETLCQGSVADPEEVKRFLAIIERHVKRLTAIVDDLMQLARIEQDAERPYVRLESVPVQPILQAAVQLCKPGADEKAMTIDMVCEDTLKARLDADLMEQAIVNLLDNAVKHNPPHSRIELSARVMEGRLHIQVRDEGIGIARKHLSRLFERFYRVDKARSRRMGGTGLGLAIVKHIVQAHSGQVTVESVQGKGSTFTIVLPAVSER